MRGMSARAFAFAAAATILITACSTTGTPSGGGTTAGDQGNPFVFASTQFSPVTEQENMRKKILAAYQGASVDFVTDNEPTILNRISAEAKAGGEQQIGLAGLENGQFAALVAAGAFDDVTKIADKHKDQKIPQDMLTLGKFGGNAQVYIPWMQATYFMVASKQALQYLPAGPKGRYYMSVVIGLGIPKASPNKAGAEALIDYLLKPETQIVTLRENSFFPVVDVKMPSDLNKGLQLEADAVAKQANSKDAKVVPLPVGLGGKGGEFNKTITDTFVRVVVKNEPVQTVLDEQAAIIQKIMTDGNIKCWGPDGTSTGACQVK